jgi:hypothetical protein
MWRLFATAWRNNIPIVVMRGRNPSAETCGTRYGRITADTNSQDFTWVLLSFKNQQPRSLYRHWLFNKQSAEE